MCLVNESSKLESVSRVHEIEEKSLSSLDHPRIGKNATKTPVVKHGNSISSNTMILNVVSLFVIKRCHAQLG